MQFNPLWTLMDTSFWQTLNQGIAFKTTKKQFFGKYLWRLEILCEFADLINPVYTDMAAEITRRQKQQAIRKNFGGSWRYLIENNYDKVDYVLLQTVRNVRKTYQEQIKIRTENPRIQFYTQTQEQLKIIAQSLSNSECLCIVTGPAQGTESMLLDDKIIATGRITHRYKVNLRDGSYNQARKQQILALLQSQGEDVKITAGTVHGLNRPYPGMWGAFFYCDDLAITTMLSLVSPGIIGKIHEVVHV